MAPQQKNALFFASLPHTFDRLCETLAGSEGVTVDRRPRGCVWATRGIELQLELATSVQSALDRIEREYYSLIVVDCRHLPGDGADAERQERELHELLDALRDERARERRYPFQRIVVLVGDPQEERVDRLIFELGRRAVGACVRDLTLSPRLVGDAESGAREAFVEQFWSFCRSVLLERRSGKKAISCAGGGIAGIYYEIGVLKCLHDALESDIRDFDMYFGISAGALVNGCLANGVHVDELIANLGARNGDWLHRLQLRARHLNVRELPRRLIDVQKELAAYVGDMVRGTAEFSLSEVVGHYDALLAPVFDNAELGRFLHELYSAPGRTDDFRKLRRQLFVGATDQDTREHVVFGEPGADHVPISAAVRASAAANPFFPSVEIDGRFYTDGMLTRTSNLTAAIEKGADLIFVIDPFVPMISDRPGDNARHGTLWLVEQDIKTLAYTRFEQVSEQILRRNPHVSAYTFVPSKRMRRLMTQNPFTARNFDAIVCEAYCSTYRRLRALEYKIRGELFSHGILFDLDRVQEMAERLESTSGPRALTLIGADAVRKAPRCSVP